MLRNNLRLHFACITHAFEPVENTIRQHFLPSLTRQNTLSDADMMALPVQGFGIVNPCRQSRANICASEKMTLVALILQQSHSYSSETKNEKVRARKDLRTCCRWQEALAASELKDRLLSNLQKVLTVSTEKGASSWLSTMAIDWGAWFGPPQGCLQGCTYYAYAMAGAQYTCPLTASEDGSSQLSKLWTAPDECFHRSTTTKSTTSLLTYWVRSVMGLVPNPACSL